MKVHEKRSHEVGTRKHRAENKSHEAEKAPKKAKSENNNNGRANGKSATDIAVEFEEFCKATIEQVSIEQMRLLLEVNGQDFSDVDDAVVPRCQDMLFYGALERCPFCNSQLDCSDSSYSCKGPYSDWSTCTFSTTDSLRSEEPIKLPDSIWSTAVSDLLKSNQEGRRRPKRNLGPTHKPFAGMTIALSGWLSRTHHYWRTQIEKHGGKVSNTVAGATCLVVSPAERQRGGSLKVAEAIERGIPVVSEAWLRDSIEKQQAQPLDAYDVVSALVGGKEIPGEEALEYSISAELKLYGKRGVHKDTKLQEKGGKIFEKDGILFNCALSLCDQGRGQNDYCIMQLIMVLENHLYLYYKKGRIGNAAGTEETLEEWDNVDDAVKEFARHFEELTGNEFEPWEREKKFQKKSRKFYPIDMDDGVDARYGGLAPRQLGIAVAQCKLDPFVANFMKVLCSQEIYKYALMEMGLDSPDLPMGMLSNFHLNKCEEVLLQFIEAVKSTKETGQRAEGIWSDYSQRWFTLMPSTRPFIFRDYQELADHAAAAFETVRDVTVASHLIGDMTGSSIDDPLFDRYKKLGCSISPLEKNSEDYKMILNYLEKTYEPVKVGDVSYGASVDRIFSVESSACPSYEEIKKLPNKFLLWCGTRTSNLLRDLHRGFLPTICSLPVPGYVFGKAIVCSDAAAEASRYGFSAVDRPEGFLGLAVASLGDQIIELKSPPEQTKSLEEKQLGVKGLGRKKPDESEHLLWKDNIKVPCGRLVPSGHKDSPLKYNEYAIYNPKQVSMQFLVGVKFHEKRVVMDTEE